MALIISVLHNFVNIFIHILYSFAYFSQSRASSIVHLLYWNDTFSTSLVSFVYHLPRILSILAIHRFPACPLSCGRSPFFLPRAVPRGAVSYCGTYFPAAQKQRGPSGAPAVCRIHILFTYRSDPGVQAPGPGILQARSPLALDHDTDDLFIGLFSFRPLARRPTFWMVFSTPFFTISVAAVELLAFDVHIIA